MTTLPPPHDDAAMPQVNPALDTHKQRRGFSHLKWATVYSWQGLQQAVRDSEAFRIELMLVPPAIALACWMGRTWLETIALVAVLALVLVVELLNCAVEAAIDRIGYEIHPLSKAAKDFGSAAVFVASVLCATVWGSYLLMRLVL